MKPYCPLIPLLTLLLSASGAAAQTGDSRTADMRDSGGTPIEQRLKYDVGFYDLDLRVEPDREWIGGHLTMTATAIEDLAVVVLHLDTLLRVTGATAGTRTLEEARWERRGGLIYVDPGAPIPRSTRFSVGIEYSGHPLYVENSDEGLFGDGFYFERTPGGEPWVSLVSVLTGADVWMPVKDHPSDEPDSMALHITAPEPLTVASNGRLRGITRNSDGTRTHHWFVSTPINNYGATVNIAPYRTIEVPIRSVAGDRAFSSPFGTVRSGRSSVPMRSPPRTPTTVPNASRAGSPRRSVARCEMPLDSSISSATMARTAPIPSANTASPSRIVERFRRTRMRRSTGWTTVGPLTTRSAPNGTESCQLQPMSQCAARAPPIPATIMPTVTRRRSDKACPRELLEAQVEAALEQDHRHRHPHQVEQGAIQAFGLHHSGQLRPQQHAGEQEQHDAGHPYVAGHHLDQHTHGKGEPDGEAGAAKDGLHKMKTWDIRAVRARGTREVVLRPTTIPPSTAVLRVLHGLPQHRHRRLRRGLYELLPGHGQHSSGIADFRVL